MLVTKEPHPNNHIQMLINLTLDSINEAAEEQLKNHDEWKEIRTEVLAKKFRQKAFVYRFIMLEKTVLRAVKARTVPQGLDRREYFFDLVRINRLSNICAKRRQNYDPVSSTAVDDRAVCTQLETDLLSLQMKVKQWEQGQELYIQDFLSKSKEKRSVLIEAQPEAIAAIVDQPKTSSAPVDDTPSAELQIAYFFCKCGRSCPINFGRDSTRTFFQ